MSLRSTLQCMTLVALADPLTAPEWCGATTGDGLLLGEHAAGW